MGFFDFFMRGKREKRKFQEEQELKRKHEEELEHHEQLKLEKKLREEKMYKQLLELEKVHKQRKDSDEHKKQQKLVMEKRLVHMDLDNIHKEKVITRHEISIIGSIVKFRYNDDMAIDEFKIIESNQYRNLDQGEITIECPLGKALVYSKVGDKVQVKAPGGSYFIEILSVTNGLPISQELYTAFHFTNYRDFLLIMNSGKLFCRNLAIKNGATFSHNTEITTSVMDSTDDIIKDYVRFAISNDNPAFNHFNKMNNSKKQPSCELKFSLDKIINLRKARTSDKVANRLSYTTDISNLSTD